MQGLATFSVVLKPFFKIIEPSTHQDVLTYLKIWRGPNFCVDKYGIFQRFNTDLAILLHHLINKDLKFSKELFKL